MNGTGNSQCIHSTFGSVCISPPNLMMKPEQGLLLNGMNCVREKRKGLLKNRLIVPEKEKCSLALSVEKVSERFIWTEYYLLNLPLSCALLVMKAHQVRLF